MSSRPYYRFILVERADGPKSIISSRFRIHPGNLLPLFPELPYNVVEGFVHVDVILRRCFDEITAQLFGESAPLLSRHFSFGHAITFIANKHDGRWTGEVAYGG